MTSKT